MNQAFAVPTESTGGHPDTPLVPLQHEHAAVAAREARASTKALQWIGPIAPNVPMFFYLEKLSSYPGLFSIMWRRSCPLLISQAILLLYHLSPQQYSS